MVVGLVGGRAAYRLALYGAGLALLTLWGPAEFALYAGATGAVGWLFALTSSGPEKAALALIPRAGGALLERGIVWLAVTPFATVTLAYLALLVGGVGEPMTRLVAAAGLSVGVGCCAVLVALYRIRGRPRVDTLTYCGIATGYAIAVGLAAGAGFGVDAVLDVLLGVVTVLIAGLVAGLVARLDPARASRRSTMEALRAAAVLGVSEILGAASSSVLYAILAVFGDPAETSRFYLLMIVAGAFAVGWSYLLRLVQPWLVGRLEQRGRGEGWRTVGRLSAWSAGVGGILTAALVAVVRVRGDGWPQSEAALLLEVALYAATTGALLVAENIDAHGRRWSAAGAVAQFATVAGVGWWLVPVAGAAGGFAALCVGATVKAILLSGIASRVAAHETTKHDRRRPDGPMPDREAQDEPARGRETHDRDARDGQARGRQTHDREARDEQARGKEMHDQDARNRQTHGEEMSA
jgi:hypothetical protein